LICKCPSKLTNFWEIVFSNPFKILIVITRAAIPIANPDIDEKLANEVKLSLVGERR
jgi:hypothetical protein